MLSALVIFGILLLLVVVIVVISVVLTTSNDVEQEYEKTLTIRNLSPDTLKVGVLASNKAFTGLHHDVLTFLDLMCKHIPNISVMSGVYNHKSFTSNPWPKTSPYEHLMWTNSVESWLATMNVIVCFECIPLQLYRTYQRYMFIPNLESTNLTSLLQKSNIDVIARTPKIQKRLFTMYKCQSFMCWWTSSLPVLNLGSLNSECTKFLFNGGGGGTNNRRGYDLCLEAWDWACKKSHTVRDTCSLTVKLTQHLPCPNLKFARNIKTCYDSLSESDMSNMLFKHDCVLYPSRCEGLGLGIIEAQHFGKPIILTDGWPMNEICEHEHDALIVPAKNSGQRFAADEFCVNVKKFGENIIRIAENSLLFQRLHTPQPSLLTARKLFVEQKVLSVLIQTKRPLVTFVCATVPQSRQVSSVIYQAQALETMGFHTEIIDFKTTPQKLEGRRLIVFNKLTPLPWLHANSTHNTCV